MTEKYIPITQQLKPLNFFTLAELKQRAKEVFPENDSIFKADYYDHKITQHFLEQLERLEY